MSVGRETRATVDVATTAKDPSFAGCGGSNRRETVVAVETVEVSSSVDEWAQRWWSRSLE